MGYKQEIKILFFLLLIGVLVIILRLFTNGYTCDSLLTCLRISIFGAPYQYFFLPIVSVLLSVIPFFFLKEYIYTTWKKFALFGIPIIAILIFLSPVRAGGDYITLGYTREIASMLFSGMFATWLSSAPSL